MAPPGDRPDPDRRPNALPPGRPVSAPPDARVAGAASDHVTQRLLEVAHELGNLLDGALRTIELARRGLDDDALTSPTGEQTARRIGVVHEALGRMANLLRDTMRPGAAPAVNADTPLIEALLHAAEVHQPLADAHRVELTIECSPRLVLTPAGPLYTVVANGIRNAIETIAASGVGSRVSMIAEMELDGAGRPDVVIDIIDDGPGLPDAMGEKPFEPGFTTKPLGFGIGLALARDIVAGLDGEISLTNNLGRNRSGRGGARLRVRCPAGAGAPKPEGS